jgi:hypothetical protein
MFGVEYGETGGVNIIEPINYESDRKKYRTVMILMIRWLE